MLVHPPPSPHRQQDSCACDEECSEDGEEMRAHATGGGEGVATLLIVDDLLTINSFISVYQRTALCRGIACRIPFSRALGHIIRERCAVLLCRKPGNLEGCLFTILRHCPAVMACRAECVLYPAQNRCAGIGRISVQRHRDRFHPINLRSTVLPDLCELKVCCLHGLVIGDDDIATNIDLSAAGNCYLFATSCDRRNLLAGVRLNDCILIEILCRALSTFRIQASELILPGVGVIECEGTRSIIGNYFRTRPRSIIISYRS